MIFFFYTFTGKLVYRDSIRTSKTNKSVKNYKNGWCASPTLSRDLDEGVWMINNQHLTWRKGVYSMLFKVINFMQTHKECEYLYIYIYEDIYILIEF